METGCGRHRAPPACLYRRLKPNMARSCPTSTPRLHPKRGLPFKKAYPCKPKDSPLRQMMERLGFPRLSRAGFCSVPASDSYRGRSCRCRSCNSRSGSRRLPPSIPRCSTNRLPSSPSWPPGRLPPPSDNPVSAVQPRESLGRPKQRRLQPPF